MSLPVNQFNHIVSRILEKNSVIFVTIPSRSPFTASGSMRSKRRFPSGEKYTDDINSTQTTAVNMAIATVMP